MNLRDQILVVRADHGFITPSLLVEVARPEDHPLHTRFEWDDSVAAEAHRRRQAHELIRSCRVVYREPTDTDPGIDVRAFQAIRTDDERQYVYEPTEEVATDPLVAALVLREAERRWKELHRQYAHLAEFMAMVRSDVEAAAA